MPDKHRGAAHTAPSPPPTAWRAHTHPHTRTPSIRQGHGIPPTDATSRHQTPPARPDATPSIGAPHARKHATHRPRTHSTRSSACRAHTKRRSRSPPTQRQSRSHQKSGAAALPRGTAAAQSPAGAHAAATPLASPDRREGRQRSTKAPGGAATGAGASACARVSTKAACDHPERSRYKQKTPHKAGLDEHQACVSSSHTHCTTRVLRRGNGDWSSPSTIRRVIASASDLSQSRASTAW